MSLGKPQEYVELVTKAQGGDIDSLDQLVLLVRNPLKSYVFRLTLHEDLTQDIVQETLLEMFKVLGKLNRADRLWPWLCKIALNKVHRHYRTENRRKTILKERIEYIPMSSQQEKGLSELVGQELRQVVLEAMSRLKLRQREVLALRCYENLEYADIAEVMKCTEFNARVMFFRAKKALQRQLSRNGFGKGALLGALVIFGKLTAPSQASALKLSVASASLKVGAAASAVGFAGSAGGLTTIAATGILTLGTALILPALPESWPFGPDAAAPTTHAQADAAASAYEQYWYYYPQSVPGPVMLRYLTTTSASDKDKPFCQWMQNDYGNYYYDRPNRRLLIRNYRVWRLDGRVWRLPTDSPELWSFLDQVEGSQESLAPISYDASGSGLLVALTREKGAEPAYERLHLPPNLLDELWFRYNWPTPVRVEDQRSLLHQRGWCWIVISGQIAGEPVSGVGRMPFVYDAYKSHPPYLQLAISDRLQIVDTPAAAAIRDADGQVLAACPSESFWAGFCRPWMGLHTLDLIRRDAAAQRIAFQTVIRNGDDAGRVSLHPPQGQIDYEIDMTNDWINSITFEFERDGGVRRGELHFEYLGETDPVGAGYTEPQIRIPDADSLWERPGLMWLVYLAEGNVARRDANPPAGR
ncbi:MAG: sigma-70 family RNA polymerase sigma factor [Sedimentisphaerales bacterium]|nr:sigma-70 family RNA polymerase sigma factor [Sedimentisphaerales bacterium]